METPDNNSKTFGQRAEEIIKSSIAAQREHKEVSDRISKARDRMLKRIELIKATHHHISEAQIKIIKRAALIDAGLIERGGDQQMIDKAEIRKEVVDSIDMLNLTIDMLTDINDSLGAMGIDIGTKDLTQRALKAKQDLIATQKRTVREALAKHITYIRLDIFKSIEATNPRITYAEGEIKNGGYDKNR